MQEEEQQNKPHKINSKLEKKRKNEKKHVKEKKSKKKDNEKKPKNHKKIKKVKEQDESQINYKKLKKVISKFITYYKDSLDDFYNIFINLDAPNGAIDISGIEDKTIKKRLYQMFKYMKLDFNSETSEYKKPDRIKSISIKRIIQKQIENAMEKNEQSEKELSDENCNEVEQKQEKEEKSVQQIDNAQMAMPPQQQIQTIQITQNQQDPMPMPMPMPMPKQYGPSFQRAEFIKNLNINQPVEQEEQHWMGENKNLDKFLNETFGQIEKEDSLNQCLSKRMVQKNNQKIVQIDENIDNSKYIGARAKQQLTEEEDKIQQDEIKEYMKQYDEKFRGKSLLEEHRVILLRTKKIEKNVKCTNCKKTIRQRNRFESSKMRYEQVIQNDKQWDYILEQQIWRFEV